MWFLMSTCRTNLPTFERTFARGCTNSTAINGQDFRKAGHIIHSNTGDGYLFDSDGKAVDKSIGLPVTLGGPLTKGRAVSVVAAAQSSNISLSPELASTDYQVAVTLHWDAGGWWITNQTKSGFTINWANPAPPNSSLDGTVSL